MRTPNWPQPFAKFLSIGPVLNQLLRWPIPAQMFEEFASFTDYPLFCSPHITLTPNLKNIGFYSERLRQKSYLISSVWWGAERAKPSVWVQFICRHCHPGNGSLSWCVRWRRLSRLLLKGHCLLWVCHALSLIMWH